MPLDQLLRSQVMSHWTNPKTSTAEKRRFHWRRRIMGVPHRVHYFHQVDDPYSHLAVQRLQLLREHYQVEIQVHIVPEPTQLDAPEPLRLAEYANVDCQRIAPHYGLRYKPFAQRPSRDVVALANHILGHTDTLQWFENQVGEVSQAVADNDLQRLVMLSKTLGIPDSEAARKSVRQKLFRNQQRRKRMGHYLGATFFYASQWYWGVDRFDYLEQALCEQGLHKYEPLPVATRPAFQQRRNTQSNNMTLEYFFSLRSPYTYISMAQVFALAENMKVNLRLRPVLPMMMRGVPATMAKGKYIFSDAKREAEQVFHVPFGPICDPIGKPVERGYSLYFWAQREQKAKEYLQNFYQAAFAEGRNLSKDREIRKVVERSGLDWKQAKVIIDNNEWQQELERNRLVLYHELGLWGVPSFRLSVENRPLLHCWGADRLWLLEHEIARNLDAPCHTMNNTDFLKKTC